MAPSRPRLAILVDADSIPVGVAARAFPLAVRLGLIARCTVYGNLPRNIRPCWRAAAAEVRGLPAPKLVHRSERDAAGFSAAFDEITEGPAALDGICLLSSDGDFATVVRRFRAAGLAVHVFGRPEAPRPLCAAASSFHAIPTSTGLAPSALAPEGPASA